MKGSEVVQIHVSEGAVKKFRVDHLQEILSLLGKTTTVVHARALPERRVKIREFLEGSRILILHRLAYNALLEIVVLEARAMGLAVVFECDDLVFVPQIDPRWVHGIAYLSPADRAEYSTCLSLYQKMLELSDAVLVSTEFLRTFAHAWGKPAYVLRNAVDLEAMEQASRWKQAREHGQSFVIVYASGSKTHDLDFQEFQTALQLTMNENPHILLRIIGHLELDATWDDLKGRIERMSMLPYDEYFDALAQADLALGPLESDNPFCRAKSELKFIEAGAWGIPTLASRAGGFAETVRHGEDGFLVANSEEQFSVLRNLVRNREQCLTAGARARARIESDFNTRRRMTELQDILTEIASH